MRNIRHDQDALSEEQMAAFSDTLEEVQHILTYGIESPESGYVEFALQAPASESLYQPISESDFFKHLYVNDENAEAALEVALRARPDSAIVVYGGPGTGKTSLVMYVLRGLSLKNGGLFERIPVDPKLLLVKKWQRASEDERIDLMQHALVQSICEGLSRMQVRLKIAWSAAAKNALLDKNVLSNGGSISSEFAEAINLARELYFDQFALESPDDSTLADWLRDQLSDGSSPAQDCVKILRNGMPRTKCALLCHACAAAGGTRVVLFIDNVEDLARWEYFSVFFAAIRRLPSLLGTYAQIIVAIRPGTVGGHLRVVDGPPECTPGIHSKPSLVSSLVPANYSATRFGLIKLAHPGAVFNSDNTRRLDDSDSLELRSESASDTYIELSPPQSEDDLFSRLLQPGSDKLHDKGYKILRTRLAFARKRIGERDVYRYHGVANFAMHVWDAVASQLWKGRFVEPALLALSNANVRNMLVHVSNYLEFCREQGLQVALETFTERLGGVHKSGSDSEARSNIASLFYVYCATKGFASPVSGDVLARSLDVPKILRAFDYETPIEWVVIEPLVLGILSRDTCVSGGDSIPVFMPVRDLIDELSRVLGSAMRTEAAAHEVRSVLASMSRYREGTELIEARSHVSGLTDAVRMDDEVRILPRGYLLLSRLAFKYRYVFTKIVTSGYWPSELESDRVTVESSDFHEPFAGALTLCFARDLCDLEISVLCKSPNLADGRAQRSQSLADACRAYSSLVCPSRRHLTCLALRVLQSFSSYWGATGGFPECGTLAQLLKRELVVDLSSMRKGWDPRFSTTEQSVRNELLGELSRTLPR